MRRVEWLLRSAVVVGAALDCGRRETRFRDMNLLAAVFVAQVAVAAQPGHPVLAFPSIRRTRL